MRRTYLTVAIIIAAIIAALAIFWPDRARGTTIADAGTPCLGRML